MKNLITKLPKDLPKKEKIKNPDRWNGGTDMWHKTNGVDPYKRMMRILEAHKGKQFDTAFSVFCSQVPVYQQHIFLEYFKKDSFRQSDYWTHFFVDKQGNIKKHIGTYKTQHKKKAIYYSDDYKTEKRHKKTGKKLPEHYWIFKGKFNENDFVDTIVSGYYIEFSSPKDPEFIRLTTDQKKRKKAAARKAEKEKVIVDYSFISNSEKELKKEKEKNKLKIEVKGFDYETSFRDNGINPDAIKDHQNKKI